MYRIFDYAKLYLLITALLMFHKAVAQNLVVNGGFETYTECPTIGSLVTNATGWMNLNGTTPDFFHACGNVVPLYLSMNGTPKNFAGNEPPHSGKAIGMVQRCTHKKKFIHLVFRFLYNKLGQRFR